MKNKIFTLLCVLGVCVGLAACAQSKKSNKTKASSTKKSKTAYAVHLESLTERILPGRQETEPTTNVYHIVIWKSTQLPEAFYWKDNSIWTPCAVSKAHASKKKLTGELKYTTEDINVEQIKNGDTLMLTAFPAEGKNVIPAEVPRNAKSTIYYKTAKTNWLPIPVTKYRELPDIIMP